MALQLIILNLQNRHLEITDTAQNLLRHIHLAGMDWMHACGGKGRCTTCRAEIVSGMENLSLPSPAEIRFREQNRLLPSERLMCQTFLLHDTASIIVPEDCQLPHLFYDNPTTGF